ncbi:extracellular solute-binding protein [Sediminibacterium soli]|uniref:extracellular solute-binding protein n=1 Tax=Sediminibacterium soli TaxID=2698829 RepID=UPI00137A4342|nr:extracellular solute-binding protein [Sediminibacterium soli]NCI48164.1 extracellular solute-binding protein [Sediminibacterium soli]
MEAVLNGITWGHSRGFTPLLAASQRYEELHPGIRVQWKKRTLQEFADVSINGLAKTYDLLIIDHPSAGLAAATGCLLPLNEYLTPAYLQDQLTHSVGNSHLSYQYDQVQWALAIDAATPAASFREDLLLHHKEQVPRTWEEVLALARKGLVAVPAIPIDLLMNFYSFCIACGATPFTGADEVIDKTTGIQAIETMRQLYALVDRDMFHCNPIAVAELMSATDRYAYCPFAYGYSNYSRTGFARHLLRYTAVVKLNGRALRTTIGGAGLAVSAHCASKKAAVDFVAWLVSGPVQKTLYLEHGGQPGHRSAWTDAGANRLTHDYFTNVLPVMDNGYTRPRYDGYLYFQDHAGTPLRKCLMDDGDAQTALDAMNELYRESLVRKQSITTV